MSGKPPALLRIACVLSLVSLALIAWAILHPVPLAVIAAMSVAQGIGALGTLSFLWIVVRDIRASVRPAETSDSDRS